MSCDLPVFLDGREWSCHLHEEIEASCSKLNYKEKSNVLQLVMHKKIPLNTWPTYAVRTPAHCQSPVVHVLKLLLKIALKNISCFLPILLDFCWADTAVISYKETLQHFKN